jgi:hypothetical protein
MNASNHSQASRDIVVVLGKRKTLQVGTPDGTRLIVTRAPLAPWHPRLSASTMGRPSMTKDELRAALEPWRARNRRRAWRPKPTAGGATTWFGGNPSGTPGEPWPTCSICSAPMRFLLQLNLQSIPTGTRTEPSASLVQLFYCSTDDGECETWRAHSGAHHFRIRSPTATIQPGPLQPLAQVVIGGWDEFDDFPAPAEHELLGVHHAYDFRAGLVTVRCDDPALTLPALSLDMDVAETISTAAVGDKLWGWPSWVQGVEYPACPTCNERMSFLLQIDSNDNLDYMFGDAGTAHITRCSAHPDQLAFGWACG